MRKKGKYAEDLSFLTCSYTYTYFKNVFMKTTLSTIYCECLLHSFITFHLNGCISFKLISCIINNLTIDKYIGYSFFCF